MRSDLWSLEAGAHARTHLCRGRHRSSTKSLAVRSPPIPRLPWYTSK